MILDLAVMLTHIFRESDVGFDRWEQLRSWLLGGYESVSTLSDSERRAIDDVIIERLLIEVRYLHRTSLGSRSLFDAGGVRKRYRLAEHVLKRNEKTARNRADVRPELAI